MKNVSDVRVKLKKPVAGACLAPGFFYEPFIKDSEAFARRSLPPWLLAALLLEDLETRDTVAELGNAATRENCPHACRSAAVKIFKGKS